MTSASPNRSVVDRVGGRDRDVVAVDLEQQWRVELECLFGGDGRRQRLVVDDHHVGGVLGLHDRLGEHRDDGLADEAHPVDRQRRASEVVVDRGHALERGEADVGGSEHGDDTRCVTCCRRVDRR